MSWHPKEKEIQQVIQLNGDERYKYFLKKVADTGKVWGLNNKGWALAGDGEEKKVLPLWPAKEYAELCAHQAWDAYKAEEVDVHDFLDKYIEELSKDNILVAVFYTPNDKGVIPTYEQLKKDLEYELSRVE